MCIGRALLFLAHCSTRFASLRWLITVKVISPLPVSLFARLRLTVGVAGVDAWNEDTKKVAIISIHLPAIQSSQFF